MNTFTKDKEDEDKEDEEKILKEKNVCFFNIPESDENDLENAYKDDISKLKNILHDQVDLSKNDVESVYRIGPKRKSISRPIIMKVTSVEKKTEILKLRNFTYDLSNKATKPVMKNKTNRKIKMERTKQ